MGWRLAEEIAWARPEHPGPEWWTLMDIAQDARDETRQGMPGMEYLMARGKCSKRTAMRRLEALRDQKLVTVVRKSAPGVRAIYEIAAIHMLPLTGATNADTRTGATDADTRPSLAETNGCHPGPERVPETGPTGASVLGTHPVNNPVTTTPSPPTAQVVTTSLEVRTIDGRKVSQFEYEAWQQVQESRRSRNA